MDNLYYSKKDATLFWVAGYTGDGNTNNVFQIADILVKYAHKFSRIANVDTSDVCTDFIEQSSRFSRMRVFYVKTEFIPDEYAVFHIRENKTMQEFLSY
ncbi:MAG: hypothetical protein IPN33_25710 [Saprospiraceae bacterium]|nr:hypothetical protein [Saprospiraceae bacterium]